MNIIQGDCLSELNSVDSNTVDCVICDGPYLKAYSTGHRKNVERATTEIQNDRQFNYPELFSQLKRVMKEDAHLYVFGCWQTGDYMKQTLEQFFKIKSKLIFVKNNWTGGDLWWSYGQSYEEIWFAMNGRKKLNGGRHRDCLFYDRVAGKKQLHLNQKPLEMIKFLIQKSSQENDLVLDPFMGVGTTALACKELNRRFVGMEIEEKYVEITKERLK